MLCGRVGGLQPASAPSDGSCRKRNRTRTAATRRRRRSCRPPSLRGGAASVSKKFYRRRPPSPPSVVAGSRERARRAEAFGSWALYARRALKPEHHLTTWPGNVFAAWLGGRRWDELRTLGRRTRSWQPTRTLNHALTTPSKPGEHGRRDAAAAEAQQRIRSLRAEPQARRAKPEPPLRRALCRVRAGPTRAPPAAAAGRARGGFPSAYARAPSAARRGRAGCPCPSRRAHPSPPLDPPLPTRHFFGVCSQRLGARLRRAAHRGGRHAQRFATLRAALRGALKPPTSQRAGAARSGGLCTAAAAEKVLQDPRSGQRHAAALARCSSRRASLLASVGAASSGRRKRFTPKPDGKNRLSGGLVGARRRRATAASAGSAAAAGAETGNGERRGRPATVRRPIARYRRQPQAAGCKYTARTLYLQRDDRSVRKDDCSHVIG